MVANALRSETDVVAEALLDRLCGAGVIVRATGDRLEVDAPAGVVTDMDRAALRRYKPQILAILRSGERGHDTNPALVPINTSDTPPVNPSPSPQPERWTEFYSAPPFELALQDRVTWERVVALMADLDDHGVIVTAWSDQRLHVSGPEAPPLPLQRAVRDEAALIRAYVACPNCQQRHSLSPPFGWCWPCRKQAEEAARSGGHTGVRVQNGRLEYGPVLCSKENDRG